MKVVVALKTQLLTANQNIAKNENECVYLAWLVFFATLLTQQIFSSSKSVMKAREKCVKYVQS